MDARDDRSCSGVPEGIPCTMPYRTHSADRSKQTVDLAPLKNLGVTAKQEHIQWRMPIIYSNVLPDPLKYDKSGPKEGIIGILALGIVQLPEYGDSGEVEIESGSAAFFLESDSVVYRSCGGSRGILFYISIKKP